MACGVGLFGVLTGYLANAFLSPQQERRRTRHPTRPPPRAPPETDAASLADIQRL